MKIAIHNPFIKSAEVVSSESVIIAGKKLGYEIQLFNYVKDIEEFNPDFVLVTQHTLPKLTRFPTYGYLQANLKHYDSQECRTALLSWDGYLTPSSKILEYIKALCHAMGKLAPKDIFYNTSHIAFDTNNQHYQTTIEILKNPSLTYVGFNWDNRYLELVKLLSKEKYFKIFGPKCKWQSIVGSSYKGELPYNEDSVIKAYQAGGVGLALQSAFYVYDDVISNRIFEINSAGGVVITPNMPFIEKYYKDTVLYFDPFAPAKEIHKQINEHMQWIKNNPEKALDRALQAQEIFHKQLSIERLLPNVIEYHKEASRQAGYVEIFSKEECPEIAVIVRTGGRNFSHLTRTLDSIVNQTYKNIRIVIAVYKHVEGLLELIESYREKFNNQLDVIEEISNIRSTSLWAGLNHVKKCEYSFFSILDDDDEIFPNHLTALYKVINDKAKMDQKIHIATSSALYQKTQNIYKYLQISDNRGYTHQPHLGNKSWAIPCGMDLIKLTDNLCVSNFLCSTEILDVNILKDPEMEIKEDVYLTLSLFQKALPYFSYRTTTLIYHHEVGQSDFSSHPKELFYKLKLNTLLFDKRVTSGKLISNNFLPTFITYPEYIYKAHMRQGVTGRLLYLIQKTIRALAKVEKLRPYKSLIILFITKPMRFIVRILRRIYYLQ